LYLKENPVWKKLHCNNILTKTEMSNYHHPYSEKTGNNDNIVWDFKIGVTMAASNNQEN